MDQIIRCHRLRASDGQYAMTDEQQIREELRLAKQRGYAIDDEETFEGVRCVAAPVRNHRDEIIAAMGISGPSTRLSLDRLNDFGLISARAKPRILCVPGRAGQ